MAKNVRYHLEIYEPGSHEQVIEDFDTEGPLYSINKGDLINLVKSPEKVLRVVALQHIVWEIDGGHVGNKLCVYTEEVALTTDLLKGRV